MLLVEIVQLNKPIFAWLAPGKGPKEVLGVKLFYVDPLEQHYKQVIKYAKEENRPVRIERLQNDRDRYRDQGKKFFVRSIGWWLNEQTFRQGKEGFGGTTLGMIQFKYPNLRIFSSKEEAVKAAQEAGLF